MTKTKKILTGLGIWLGVGLVVALALVAGASAHTNISHGADCAGVYGSFESFPAGEQTVTIYVDGGYEADRTFTGPAGSVSAPWSDVGVDTGDGLVHTYGFAWDADGGGNAGPFDFDASGCVPPDTTVPPTTVPCDPAQCPEPPPCYDPYTPDVPGCPTIPPTTVPDLCDDGSLPPCVDPDITVVPPPPAGPVEGSPRSTG